MAAIGINGVGCLKRLTLQKFEDGKRRKRGGGGAVRVGELGQPICQDAVRSEIRACPIE